MRRNPAQPRGGRESTSEPADRATELWLDDEYGYFERYVDAAGRWTGWVTEVFWDPRFDDAPDERVALRCEGWALTWFGDCIVLSGASGGCLVTPARSVVSCVVKPGRRGALLYLEVEFGGPPSAAPPEVAQASVTLTGPAELLPRFEAFATEHAEHVRRRNRGLAERPATPRPPRSGPDGAPAQWGEDTYGIFTQRLRDSRRSTGWVLDRFWDPLFGPPPHGVGISNQAAGCQLTSTQLVAAGHSGARVLVPATVTCNGGLRRAEATRHALASVRGVWITAALTAAEDPHTSSMKIDFRCDGRVDAAAELLRRLRIELPERPREEAPSEVRRSDHAVLLPVPVPSASLVETLMSVADMPTRSDLPEVSGTSADASASRVGPHATTAPGRAGASEPAAAQSAPAPLTRLTFTRAPADGLWTRLVPLDSTDEVVHDGPAVTARSEAPADAS